jgi:putative cardiolipin synthase
MDSNNHTMAHSHYKKYRKRLLKTGIELYEFSGQPSEKLKACSNTYPIESDFISLHTKAYIVDRQWVLLGSLNVDPRSIKINTEHILIIDSKKLAEQLLAQFDEMSSTNNSWRVYLNKNGKVRWKLGDKVKKIQPSRNFWQRCTSLFYRWLPIEGQL